MSPAAPEVQLSSLLLTRSDYRSGGSSTRICHAYHLNGRSASLFKEYNEKMRRALDPECLRLLAAWRCSLSNDERHLLDSFCAFPHTLVLDGNSIAGVLMGEAPAAFLRHNARNQPLPRKAEVLGRSYEKAGDKQGAYFEPPHKLALLGVLLEHVIWLHDRNVSIGDMHPGNLLVTADPRERKVFLLDCDSFWLGNRHALPRHEPDLWQVGQPSFSPATDLAKFARLVSRAVGEDFATLIFGEDRLLSILPAHHVRQLKRMWEVDPSLVTEQLRSMADDWRRLLRTTPAGEIKMFVRDASGARVPWVPRSHAAGSRTQHVLQQRVMVPLPDDWQQRVMVSLPDRQQPAKVPENEEPTEEETSSGSKWYRLLAAIVIVVLILAIVVTSW